MEKTDDIPSRTTKDIQDRQIARKCHICAKYPLKGREIYSTTLGDDHPLDFDADLHELLHRLNHPEEYQSKLNDESARRIFEKVIKHSKRLKNELTGAGLLQREDQTCAGVNERVRTIAPLDFEELELGRLLGTGGFSSSYEIISSRLDSRLDSELHAWEKIARSYVANNVQRPLTAKAVRSNHSRHQCHRLTMPRYAIKHLRRSLIQNPQHFERAAVDLMLEAYLLLVMDHPHIHVRITIRGWARQGPQAFLSGRHTDYFVIVDFLPEMLDDRILFWRRSHRKYHFRLKCPWAHQKFFSKLNDLLLQRLRVLHDAASAVEYMHERRIINRDLKAANIGFDIHGDLKIFDFGLSRLLPAHPDVDDYYAMSRVGTKYYIAPEVKQKKPYNLSADIYSFGVVMWEVFAMATPREALHRLRLEKRIEHETSSELPLCDVCWPPECVKMIQSSLSLDPRCRPCIGQIRHQILRTMGGLGFDYENEKSRRRSSAFLMDLAQAKVSIANTSNASSLCCDSLSLNDTRSIENSR